MRWDTDSKTEITGIVTEIERYSIHDGPGVRTVVFFKGCQLHCSWCCNPETINPSIEMAWFAHLCSYCKNCITDCPYGAISEGENNSLITNRSICIKHCINRLDIFPCTVHCFAGARKVIGTRMTINQVIAEVERDRNYYRRTGGGVTLSGGEVSMQPEFAVALSKCLHQRWIDVAIETNGFGNIEFYYNIAPYLSFAFFDIKTLDPVLHMNYTGGSVNKIINFSKQFSKITKANGIDVVVRIPIIPGFNDDINQILAIARFVKEELSGINKIELLPFHKLGHSKYKSLDLIYDFQDVVPFEINQIQNFHQEIANFGIEVISF